MILKQEIINRCRNVEVRNYDERGFLSYVKVNNYERWTERNDRNLVVHVKNSKGREVWYRYNDDNQLIFSIDNEGIKERIHHFNGKVCTKFSDKYNAVFEYRYDESDELLQEVRKNNKVIETYKYDENGNCIYKSIGGTEYWNEYDERSQVTYSKSSYTKGIRKLYNYDNLLIYSKREDGLETWYEYNERKQLTYKRNSKGYWESYKYNNDGLLLEVNDSLDYKEVHEYKYYSSLELKVIKLVKKLKSNKVRKYVLNLLLGDYIDNLESLRV